MEVHVKPIRYAKRLNKKMLISLGVIAGITSITLYAMSNQGFTVERQSLVIGNVVQGDFTVSVRGSGTLVPDQIQWISSVVDGNVEILHLKPGNVVTKGDLILEMSNPQLEKELAEALFDLESKEEELTALEAKHQLDIMSQNGFLLEMTLNFERSKVKYEMQSKVKHAISELDYRLTELETAQFKQRMDIANQQLETMKVNLEAQKKATQALVNKSRNSYEAIKKQVEDMKVVATFDSVVLEMPLEIGQRVSVGSNMAKLAKQHSLIVELKMPELQIKEVMVGQKMIVNTRSDMIEAKVSRIDPAVIDGFVKVDAEFTALLPANVRPDMSVDGEIKVAEIGDTLFVARPLFAQSRSVGTVYKVNDKGDFAQRVTVTFGYGSVDQIQVNEGLKAGDKIIVSDPSRFENHESFRIRQ